ncbi:hypothetical protein ACFQFH_09115 [Halobaculum halobium]|uniref:hypothetical protein n=1 Tax=Halobaculum halobium TaxID=3032281 RepID=UPI003607CB1A
MDERDVPRAVVEDDREVVAGSDAQSGQPGRERLDAGVEVCVRQPLPELASTSASASGVAATRWDSQSRIPSG